MTALNALHRHFKQAHMTGSYRIHPLRVLEAPIINNVDESEDDSSDCESVTNIVKNTEGGKDNESIEENMDEKICENCHSPEAVEEGSANAGKEDDRNKALVDANDGVTFNKIACLDIKKELEDSGRADEENFGEMPIFLCSWIVSPL